MGSSYRISENAIHIVFPEPVIQFQEKTILLLKLLSLLPQPSKGTAWLKQEGCRFGQEDWIIQ